MLYNTVMNFSITWENLGVENNNYNGFQIFGKSSEVWPSVISQCFGIYCPALWGYSSL